jgi:DNA polymerase III gamma/tau subunit
MRQLWVKKYAPNDFSQFCFPDGRMKSAIKQLLESGNIPHLLLTGQPGTGKSTLARLLIEYNEIDQMDVLRIDASLENNVDTVREKIYTFVTTSAWGNNAKIVLLEEFDHMSIQAQSTLREMMVQYSDDVRFILTANYAHKIIDAIKSRCQEYTFTGLPEATALKRAIAILDAEQIDYDPDDVAKIVRKTLPDFRKTINTLEKHCIDQKLVYGSTEGKTVADFIASGDFESALSWVFTQATPGDLAGEYQSVFEAIATGDCILDSTDKIDKGLITIAKYQFQSMNSADATICFTAMISELRLIAQGKL